MGKILIVDDEGKMRALLGMALDSHGHKVEDAESGEHALDKIKSFVPDVVITDIRMEGMSGIDLLKKIKQDHSEIEVIVMTAYADSKSGIDAMRNGAMEYVAKPFEMDEMILLVKNALEKALLQDEINKLRNTAKSKYSLNSLSTRSAKMRKTIEMAKIVAKRDTTVLIRGESGTGKELIARGIHEESGRKFFLPINCGAIPENLLESELFGYEKGAFTGADKKKPGLFENAEDGTIFLDEIGDISPALQIKLLRVLQEKEFKRVGGANIISTKARVIAATNRNLEEAVSSSKFREDLFYRLNVFPISVPQLAERSEDIPELIKHFCQKYDHQAGMDENVIKLLIKYRWPGNIRELENCMESSIIMANNKQLEVSHLPEHIRHEKGEDKSSSIYIPEEGISLDQIEKSLILQALEKSKWNKTSAAKFLGISRRAIYSKMKTHGISE